MALAMHVADSSCESSLIEVRPLQETGGATGLCVKAAPDLDTQQNKNCSVPNNGALSPKRAPDNLGANCESI